MSPIRNAQAGLEEVISHDKLTDMPDVGGTNTDHDLAYLKLDQTTPQDVDNGAPTFNKGIIIKSGQKVVFDGA